MVTTNADPDTTNQWYLDIGCSNHMLGRKEWLCDLNETVKNKVRFVDNSVISAEGAGKIMIKRNDVVQACIFHVLCVPI